MELPAESAAGVQTVDLNNDGYPEIIVHNHLKDGDHTTSSYIYWNGPNGFDRSRRTELPGFGPQVSQMTDPGNLMTRKLEEEYISSVIELPPRRHVARLGWTCHEPAGARLKFQIRCAATLAGCARSAWTGPEGKNSFYVSSGTQLRGLTVADAFVQYRAVFTSPNGGEWPILTAVEVQLR